jgi:hypothetical protein
MDETPSPPDDEQERIHREADAIDVYQYRKRSRALKAIGVGAALAGAVWLVLIMVDSRRNPCERVRDHFCKADPSSPQCQTYGVVLRESVDEGPSMRANIRAQCQSKIDRLQEEDGVKVR